MRDGRRAAAVGMNVGVVGMRRSPTATGGRRAGAAVVGVCAVVTGLVRAAGTGAVVTGGRATGAVEAAAGMRAGGMWVGWMLAAGSRTAVRGAVSMAWLCSGAATAAEGMCALSTAGRGVVGKRANGNRAGAVAVTVGRGADEMCASGRRAGMRVGSDGRMA